MLTGPDNRKPDAEIQAPEDGTRILEEESVELVGTAVDPEDGRLGGRALRWYSHLDGGLGYGDTVEVSGLTTGHHEVGLVGTDQAGAADTARIELVVGDQPEPIELPYRLEPVFSEVSLARPLNLVPHPDGDILYAAEQRGVVRRFSTSDPSGSARQVLDLRDRIYLEDRVAEEGLLGLALDPNYASTGYLYVLYTAPGPDGGTDYTAHPETGVRTVLARFRVGGSGGGVATRGTVLLSVDQPGRYHNGGQLAFGPENYLYVSIGDGGTGGDPAQHTGNLLGSILRIDPDGNSADRPYSVPSGNPFADSDSSGQPEIFAWGFRNVWRFSVDGPTGTIWAGDVGHRRYEEISVVEAGKNYGWNEREGAHCLAEASCRTAGLTDPVHEYEHAWGASVIGGHVYRGDRLGDLRGAYLFADYVSGRVWALSRSGGTVTGHRLLAQHERPGSLAGDLVEITRMPDGRLFFAALDGSIYRLVRR